MDETTKRTAITQKRIWLLRVSSLVMAAPSPEDGRWRALSILGAFERHRKLWRRAWPVQAKGSSNQCGERINPVRRSVLRSHLYPPARQRGAEGPGRAAKPDFHCRCARRRTTPPAVAGRSLRAGTARRRNAAIGLLRAPARRRCRRAPAPAWSGSGSAIG